MSETKDATQIGIVNHEGKILGTRIPAVIRSKNSGGEPKFRDEGIIRQRRGKVSSKIGFKKP